MNSNYDNTTHIVAGCKPWSKKVYNEVISNYRGTWYYAKDPEQLKNLLFKHNPIFVFFLHWSWIVPEHIVNNYECVCFHMTDLPFGRGGSPLQNLILRGHKKTKLTALKMIQTLDAGPIYMKEDLLLNGRAEEIYYRASYLAADMIKNIINHEPRPDPQVGAPVHFHRRKPSESNIKDINNLESLYDYIRMLDAEGYPLAFIEKGSYRYEFSNACLQNGKLSAKVEISTVRSHKK